MNYAAKTTQPGQPASPVTYLCCCPSPKLTWHCQTPIREIIGSCDFNLWNANKQLGLWANVDWRKQMRLKKKIVLFCFFRIWRLDRNICQVCNSPTHTTWADWKFANRQVLYWGKLPCCLPALDVLGYSPDVSHLWGTLLTEKLLHFLTSFHPKENGMQRDTA